MENKTDSPSATGTNITLSTVLCWMFGVIFVMSGLLLVSSSVSGAAMMLMAGLTLLPPVNNYLSSVHKISISAGLRFVVALILFGTGMSFNSSDNPVTATPAIDTTTTSASQIVESPVPLEIISFSCDTEYGFSKLTGQVKNISSESMENVVAVANSYTKDGKFVKSSEALVKYNPILPGQTSPFEVIDTENPLATRCELEFKKLFGGTIPTKR